MNEQTNIREKKEIVYEEIKAPGRSGMPILLLNSAVILAAIALIIICAVFGERSVSAGGEFGALRVVFIVTGGLYGFIIGPILYCGLKVLKPNEAYVLTLFGKYYGTLRGEGFYFVNPFVSAVNTANGTLSTGALSGSDTAAVATAVTAVAQAANKRISLKAMTLNNNQQKINDQLGNPIIIGVIVIWRVINTAMAVFNVDNYKEFLSIQCDSALRNIVRLYPYDVAGDDEKTLRSSSQEIADKLREELTSKTAIAGLEIIEARITNLAYAPEIASAMLQRQQASAVIDARKLIVEGAVGMVEMALEKLGEKQIVKLDEERKAAMVSNLLVVLCGNKDAQPIVNSGSLY
jgi:regulator of protease activity HflC (stomatin/prohibitin superfamily)